MAVGVTASEPEPSNVVGISGIALAVPPGRADSCTVELLRRYLGYAERGEIVGAAVAAIKPTGASRTEWGGSASADHLLAATTGLQARIAAAWVNGFEDPT